MAKGDKPTHDVVISKKGKDDKYHSTKIGAGWPVGDGGISIVLDAVPVDGKLVVFPIREKTDTG
jgi:hypothetical protein